MAEAIRRGEPRWRQYQGPDREVDRPEVGHYRARLVRGGPTVPVAICLPCPMDPWFGHPIERPRVPVAFCLGGWLDVLFVWSHCVPVGLREFRDLERRCAERGLTYEGAFRPVDLSRKRSLF